MSQTLSVGLTYEYEMLVEPQYTAAAVGNGNVEVFGTPFLLLLFELTCAKAMAPYVPEGGASVGTMANFKHLAATPVGMTVRCRCEVIEVDRARVVFTVEAHDEVELIGQGTHERFIIKDEAKFVAKTFEKSGQ